MAALVKNACLSIESFSESEKFKTFLACLQVLAASLLIALSAKISIPLYFSPVPLTGQTFAIMFIGATLGSRKGMLSVLAYLVEGSLGLPVFANGGLGLMSLFGPTGGYLLGFVCQAYLVGLFFERKTSFNASKILLVLAATSFIQLSLGVLWLSFFVGLQSAVILGFYPFVLGEAVKAVALTGCLKLKF